MTYNTSSPTVKCEKCEEHLTDFEQYEKHMAHMHGLNTLEESVVDWTLITDEDIITKDGNKYRVGGESINWSPNFDKEARIFLEEKYQKGKIEMLSKKKIDEAKKFVKALETDTNQHYDNLINKIEGKGEDSYKELFPNKEQKFPQNKMPTAKWFSHQRDEAGVTDVGIQDQGYFDDPNAVMGSQTKRFSKGKYHIDEPVAKEQFSTSFYGEYLGESKANESQGLECPNCKNKGGLWESTFAKNGYLCEHCDADITVEAIADWNDIDWLDVSDYIDKDKDARESKANELEEDGSFSVFGLIANRSEIECIAEAENFGYSCASEIFMHVYGTTKVTPEQVKQAKFILENWDLHNLHPYKTKAMYFGNESKANEDALDPLAYIDPYSVPYDEQQDRLRTARDEQSPLDNIYHSKSVADDIAGGTQDTYAQDFIGGSDGKALYDDYDDLAPNWFYDSTGVKTKKLGELKAREHHFVLGYSDPECNICGRVIHNSFEQNDDREAMQDAIYQHYNYEHSDIKNVKQLAGQQIYDQFRKTEESKASDDYEVDVDEYIKTGDPTQELPKDKRARF